MSDARTQSPRNAIAIENIQLRCPRCGKQVSGTTTVFRCACGTPFDLDPLQFGQPWSSSAEAKALFRERLGTLPGDIARSGVWRYRELVLPVASEMIVTREEGNTPLYAVGAAEHGGWSRVGAYVGLERLYLKHEGHNPTGSFKDRGMTAGMTVARAIGARAVACASTGNTSASLAAYAAQAGLPALVFLPAGKVAGGKLAQSIAYGARRIEVAGDFDRAMTQVEAVASEFGVYLLNSINPYRLAGQRSLAYEILQQMDWQPPDWIVLPAGNLGNTSALGAGLLHARALGLIDRVPRIAAIQANGADPFYRSYATNWQDRAPVHAHTRATAINIGSPVSYLRARTVIEATNGTVAEVSDDDIFAAKAIIDRAGIGCEPASAASLAGIAMLVRSGLMQRNASVVAILTGNLLKDPEQATGDQIVNGTGDAAAEELATRIRDHIRI